MFARGLDYAGSPPQGLPEARAAAVAGTAPARPDDSLSASPQAAAATDDALPEERAQRQRVIDQLAQIGRAWQMYYGRNEEAPPPQVFGPQRLSWRVLLLSELGEAKLFSKFSLAVPWDREANRQLLARIPQAFRTWDDLSGRTAMVPVTGPETLYFGRLPWTSGPLTPPSAVGYRGAIVWPPKDDPRPRARGRGLSSNRGHTMSGNTANAVRRIAARRRSLGLGAVAWAALCLVAAAPNVSAAELLFSAGPQEYEGRNYYWLAEWQLEITIPQDASPDDTFEVLFGSKGPDKRTLQYEHDGRTGQLSEVRATAYEWVPLALGRLAPGKNVVLSGRGSERVAFVAGVRITGRTTAEPNFKPVRVAQLSSSSSHQAVWAELSGFEMNDDVRKLWEPRPETPDWERARRSARYAGIALDKVQRWLHECCLPIRDARSGLFRPTGSQWNYQDTAADCYPFYVWAAYYTDLPVLDTVMREVLEAEQRLCNHLDRLPVAYDMDRQEQLETSWDAMIFGASEYAKDGLAPIVEITGKQYPWYERMRGIVDDIFQHARYETPYGLIPSTNVEVNGELLQLLPRLYGMTGEQKYLAWAHRLADFYLLPGGFVPTRLSDHGCEIIGGLGLLFAVDRTACPEKCEQYRPHLEFMFDQILQRGLNSDGVIIGQLQSEPGPHDDVPLRDGWGYDFVGFLDYDLARGTQRYRQAIERPLTNLLKPRYERFNWDHGSRDNVADSVEGGLYLLRWFPTPEAFLWADREIATLLVDHTDPDRLWGVHKLEANTVRTVLIHTMLHTRNTIARPWQQGLQLGAAPCGDGVCILMKSDQTYQGRLQFDIPRHRITMGFAQEWPRMNTVPEWFTVEPDQEYTVQTHPGPPQRMTGRQLHEGLPVTIAAGGELRLQVQP